MKTGAVDKLNIFLILISLALAFIIPFRLFIFTYAVLGPIHYLTEINWLKGKGFFIKDSKWVWILIILTAIVSFPVLLQMPIPIFEYLNEHFFKDLFVKINGVSDILLLALFLFSACLIYIKRWEYILISFILSLILAKIITKYILFSYVVVGVFLPNLIHVYLFTLLFMILGALNSKSKAGLIGIILLVLSPAFIFASNIDTSYYKITESTNSIFTAQHVRFVVYLLESFDKSFNRSCVQLSTIGIKIQVFIAFAYTYHYLNWFSKASIIGWYKNVSTQKFILFFLIWIVIAIFFYYDFGMAYDFLFFVAMLHFILELPLNITCMKQIIAKVAVKSNGEQV